ncbi:MAG TPA: TPM domain-containing protein [Candidatus Binatia bacterium]|nr:TPM domain-containing protein [Candidatus Binatia bacterium]
MVEFRMRVEKFFSEEEKTRIQQAITAAEEKTSGEIVPMLVNASARYTEIELLGLVVGLSIGTLAAAIYAEPWGHDFVYLWPMIGAAAGFLVCRIPWVKRSLLPGRQRDAAVLQRSLAAFTAEGLHHTRDHTGILIFVSLLEHEVEVLADQGINEKVPTGTWDEVVRILTAELKAGRACEGFCKAIGRCGAILAEHFPRATDDRDELSNRLVTGQ